ncbi:MAG: hypothetical protein LBT26_07395 [Clostridiales Family XIII bacterium]|jgi:hypothetical protein|nr:hypothetical protein [Clostridiales Family XIII bacterium]
MKEPLVLNYNTAQLRICVDSIENGIVGGRIFSQRLKDVLVFHDLNGLVLQSENLMNKQNYPQAFQRKRTFAITKHPPEAAEDADDRLYMTEAEVADARGAVHTLILHIVSRQNTDWQGYVDFLDGSGKTNFESVLEFLSVVSERLGVDASGSPALRR